jgi:hypothetical protein
VKLIPGRQFSYAFDALGNRVGGGYATNALNQYTSVPGGAGSVTYDPRGNLTSAGRFTYVYDGLDRLSEVYDDEVRLTFGYDAQGRRVWKKTYARSGGSWALQEHRKFAYDGWNLIAEFLVDGTQQTLLRSYAWGLGLGGGIGGLLAVVDHSVSSPATGTDTQSSVNRLSSQKPVPLTHCCQ